MVRTLVVMHQDIHYRVLIPKIREQACCRPLPGLEDVALHHINHGFNTLHHRVCGIHQPGGFSSQLTLVNSIVVVGSCGMIGMTSMILWRTPGSADECNVVVREARMQRSKVRYGIFVRWIEVMA